MTQHFVVAPEAIQGDAVVFSVAQAHQMTRVLRQTDGAEVIVLDGQGAQYRVHLSIAGKYVAGTVRGGAEACYEPARRVSLLVAPPKGDRWEWLLQKGTELGVACFQPIVTRYAQPGAAVVKPRHHEIVREAVEQCRRLKLPEIAPPRPLADALREAVQTPDHAVVMLWEGDHAGQGVLPLSALLDGEMGDAGRHIVLIVGPEGGFHDEETALARDLGVALASLGPLILRTETAALAAAALVLCR